MKKGDLSSVKIMWPRTEEERLRGRNTGFVCFMNREDASDAMNYYQESDPLNTGHRLMIRWGKDVRNNSRRGQGMSIIPSTRPSRSLHLQNTNPLVPLNRSIPLDNTMDENEGDYSNLVEDEKGALQSSKVAGLMLPSIMSIAYDATQHSKDSIHVVPPSDPSRHEFISTLAFYVAKDGYTLEKKILECESNNQLFTFLSAPSLLSNPTWANDVFKDEWRHTASLNNDSKKSIEKTTIEEYIFYRWRVFAFAQGDSFQSWRTEPFIMLYHPQDPVGGRYWIPPPLPALMDGDGTGRQVHVDFGRGERFHHRREGRRGGNISASFNKDGGPLLGINKTSERVIPNKKAALAGANSLIDSELEEWNDMIDNRLCASKDSILDAMSFCFDRSTAAVQISELLRTALLDERKGISVDTRIARLFLLSDVLFNSQQPGVKNAYRYRDAIETMAPEIFSSLGKHGKKHGEMIGRITLNKLRNAVKAVLSAWSAWSVYNTTFLEELDSLFEGVFVEPKVDLPESGTSMKIPEEKSANPIASNEVTASICSDIDGEELNEDDLLPDDIDGESLSESDYLFDLP